MQVLVTEFVDGVKKPFQTAEEQAANKSSALAAYAAILAVIAIVRG